MKKITFLLITISILLLTACSSGVSQADYDSILAENNALKSQNEALQNDFEEMKQKNIELAEKNIESLETSATEEYINAWLNTSFNEKFTFDISSDNKLHINLYYSDIFSMNLYYTMVDDLTSSMSSLGALYAMVPENISFDLITMTFYDKNNNGIIGTSFYINGSEIDTKDMMLNIQHVYEIAENASK